VGKHVIYTGVMRNAYKILVRTPEGKQLQLLQRRRHKLNDNIKMDFEETV
jgi:hypothetical protein